MPLLFFKTYTDQFFRLYNKQKLKAEHHVLRIESILEILVAFLNGSGQNLVFISAEQATADVI